jgi:serine/threonine-protein kinase HipA
LKKANVYVNGDLAGELQELRVKKEYRFVYKEDYAGPSVSLTMPLKENPFHYDRFPPFFEGLLPEGAMLDALLRQTKIDRNDLFSQLIQVGHDLVGNVTIEEG